MVKLSTSVLLKTTLFWLNCSYVFSQVQFTNFDSNADNITTEKKSECQTIFDCSEGALECRKDFFNDVSYCIYPDNLNDIPLNDINIINPTTTTTTTANIEATTTVTAPTTCITDTDCPSNKCISGQCQVDSNTFIVNGSNVNDTIFTSQNNTTVFISCSTDEDCPSKKCISGQCQIELEVELEQAALNLCNSDQPGSICGRLEGERCEKNSDCVSSFCDKKSNTCAKKGDKHGNTVSPKVTVIVASTGFCIAFVLVVLLIRKDRKEKANKIKEQYMENVQLPMYVIYSEEYDTPTYSY